MAQDDDLRMQTPWSNTTDTAVNLEKLRLLCSHGKALKREGYITAPLSRVTLLSKLRCKNCAYRMKPPRSTTKSELQEQVDIDTDAADNLDRKPSKKDLCEFHPGRVFNLKGCHTSPTHIAPDNYMEVLALNWTFHRTPPRCRGKLQIEATNMRHRARGRFINTTAKATCKAIALDCEFGVSILGEPELIRITAIDFFTQQVLIDSLVKPFVAIKNYNTRYSGVTSADLRNAVRDRTCIFGRDAAREKLFQFVDSDTIVIVHGGSSDLSSLRWIHPNIIDTFILETYFELIPGGRSLKNLCEKKFDIKIQKGRAGHDSLEDALACRELAIWMMDIIPDI